MRVRFTNPGEMLKINRRRAMRELRHSRALQRLAAEEDRRESNQRMKMKNKDPEELEWEKNVNDLYQNIKQTHMDPTFWEDPGLVNTSEISAPKNDVQTIRNSTENAIKKQTLLQPQQKLIEKQSAYENLTKKVRAKELAMSKKNRMIRSDRLY